MDEVQEINPFNKREAYKYIIDYLNPRTNILRDSIIVFLIKNNKIYHNDLESFINKSPLFIHYDKRISLRFPKENISNWDRVFNLQWEAFEKDDADHYEVLGDAWEEIGKIDYADMARMMAYEKLNGEIKFSDSELLRLGQEISNGRGPYPAFLRFSEDHLSKGSIINTRNNERGMAGITFQQEVLMPIIKIGKVPAWRFLQKNK